MTLPSKNDIITHIGLVRYYGETLDIVNPAPITGTTDIHETTEKSEYCVIFIIQY